jgi:uncharacterized protein with PQ loop repeat
MSSDVGQCASWACDTVGLGISFLQIGQFVPQHLEMRTDKSTAGLSPWLIFFGSVYTYLAFLDIALTDSVNYFTCGAGAYRCFIYSQPFYQMLLSSALSSGLWYWYLLYHRSPSSIDDEANITAGRFGHALYDAIPPSAYFTANVVICVLVTARGISLARAGDQDAVTAFAHACGHVAALLNAVMWIPQIFTTLAYGHRGALSVLWVLASIVMDVLYSIYLAYMGLDFSVWANNIPGMRLLSSGTSDTPLLYATFADSLPLLLQSLSPVKQMVSRLPFYFSSFCTTSTATRSSAPTSSATGFPCARG